MKVERGDYDCVSDADLASLIAAVFGPDLPSVPQPPADSGFDRRFAAPAV